MGCSRTSRRAFGSRRTGQIIGVVWYLEARKGAPATRFRRWRSQYSCHSKPWMRSSEEQEAIGSRSVPTSVDISSTSPICTSTISKAEERLPIADIVNRESCAAQTSGFTIEEALGEGSSKCRNRGRKPVRLKAGTKSQPSSDSPSQSHNAGQNRGSQSSTKVGVCMLHLTT